MRNKQRRLKYRKERALLSELLPFELPPTFSNRALHQFVVKHSLEFHPVFSDDKKRGHFRWLYVDSITDLLILRLLGLNPAEHQITHELTTIHGKPQRISRLAISHKVTSTTPFSFRIRHNESFRELSIPHPRLQLETVEFYDKFKELIVYYSNGPYSIRYPHRIARYAIRKDTTFSRRRGSDGSEIELWDKEYDTIRSFFVYKEFSLVFKFYESRKFHDCEKRYNKLLKLDVSKCFDSIYTHSICWALLSKRLVKDNIGKTVNTIGGRFDKLMQNMNDGETNGILIGPELSRIFAELILQSIDTNVRAELESSKLKHKIDYEIFRYVDDYFIFYNCESARSSIENCLRTKLGEFKLRLNESKASVYSKPIITEISIANQQLVELLDRELQYVNTPIETDIQRESENEDAHKPPEPKLKGSISVDSQKLITKFKTILKSTNVEYKDVMNYTLGVVEKRTRRILKEYGRTSPELRNEKQLIRNLAQLAEFVFFVYSVSPKVVTTIKLSRILSLLISFAKSNCRNFDYRHYLLKTIFDNIQIVLKKNSRSPYAQSETHYLLLSIAELGKEYQLEEAVLIKHFGMTIDSNGEIQIPSELDYLSITVILSYVKNRKRYFKLKEGIEQTIIDLNSSPLNLRLKNTENTLLFFDSIYCPYLSEKTKNKLLELNGISSKSDRTSILRDRKEGFTKWVNFDYSRALDAKRNLEVY